MKNVLGNVCNIGMMKSNVPANRRTAQAVCFDSMLKIGSQVNFRLRRKVASVSAIDFLLKVNRNKHKQFARSYTSSKRTLSLAKIRANQQSAFTANVDGISMFIPNVVQKTVNRRIYQLSVSTAKQDVTDNVSKLYARPLFGWMTFGKAAAQRLARPLHHQTADRSIEYSLRPATYITTIYDNFSYGARLKEQIRPSTKLDESFMDCPRAEETLIWILT